MKSYISKFWFFIGLAVIIPLAFIFPQIGLFLRQWSILKIMIFIAFLMTGLTLQTRKVIEEIKNIKALIAAILSSLVLFPIITLIISKLALSSQPDLFAGTCILATSPVTVASGIVLTRIAKGSVALSILICIATNLIAIFTIPISLNILMKFDTQIELPVLKMIMSLIPVVLLPTIIGQIIRTKLKDHINRCKPAFSIFSKIVILFIVLNAVSGSTENLKQMGTAIIMVFILMTILHTAILFMNSGLSKLLGLNPASSSAFILQTSQKTLTVSAVVFEGFFAAQFPLALVPSIAYHLIQLLMDTAIAHRLETRQQNVP